jgi:signal peptidase I
MVDPNYNVASRGAAPSGKKAWYLRNSTIAIFSSLLILLFFGGFLFWAVRGVHPVKVAGNTMEPALSNGDRILIARPGALKRGDIVVFRFPADPSKSFIKRIVGLPDETISISKSGEVFINGNSIPEPYVQPEMYRHPSSLPEKKIPAILIS